MFIADSFSLKKRIPIVTDSTTMATLLMPKTIELAILEFSAYRKNRSEPKFAIPRNVPNTKVLRSFRLLDLPVINAIAKPIIPAIPNATAEKFELNSLGTAVNCASLTIESVKPIEINRIAGRSIARRPFAFWLLFLKVARTTAAIAKLMPIILFGVMMSLLSKMNDMLIGMANDILLAIVVMLIPALAVQSPTRLKVMINKMPTTTAALTNFGVKKKPPEKFAKTNPRRQAIG